MPSCLGLFIENNIIKYAKISKDHDNVKVESYGIKFYDKINETIEQIVSETFSYKIPISVNLSNEFYSYFYIFSLLNKTDIPKAIETEFEGICIDNQYNKNALESRYALVNSLEDKEKLKVIHVSTNKTEINKRNQQFEGKKLNGLFPIPMTITNLLDLKSKENCVIINMEENTVVTTILDGIINRVDSIEDGSKQILDKINSKENSYAKAYEICKNTTIYTTAGRELQEEVSEHLEDIMPTLYNIVTGSKSIIEESAGRIDKIYLTGTASVINNIDLYFSENIDNIKCEILKPYFISRTNTRINFKEYVEVNSAICLALQQIEVGNKGMNFKKESFSDKLPDFLKLEIGSTKNKNEKNKDTSNKKGKINFNFKNNLGEQLDKTEKMLLRACTSLTLVILIYFILSSMLTGQMREKEKEAINVVTDTQTQIGTISSDVSKINSKMTQYKEMIKKLDQNNEELSEKYKLKEAVPNLLNQIMYVIPKDVQITSIENTNDRHIKISAQSEKYEKLAFFKGQLINEKILLSVVSDQAVKENNIVKTIIEGELP